MDGEAATVLDDIQQLKALLAERDAAILEQRNTIKELTGKLLWAEEKYRAMELKYFGRKSEHYSPEEDWQNRLFDEAELHADVSAAPVAEMVQVPAHERKKRGRKPKIDTLPVREEIHGLVAEDRRCPCCGEERPEIGEERTSEYDLVPAHVVKIVHVRKKYGPCTCDAFAHSGAATILAAPGPAKVVSGNDFTNRTIAFFLTAKYADAIPFYRMEKMLVRSGLVVSRAALCNLAVSVGRAIGDLVAMMNADLARSPVLLMDETTVQVLKEGLGPPGKKSYLWAARGYLDCKPILRFAYHHSRSGSFADTLLEGFSGYLQTDGYTGYDHLEGRADLVLVGCFAHIRRKFVTAWETAGKTGIAAEAIALIARIYRVESALRAALEKKAISETEFLARRKEQLKPVFAEFRAWLMDSALAVAPQSQLGKAIAYAQGMFDRAIRFTDHPSLTPDTNAIENAIRPFVVGRKNWLFSGSPLGAHASAGLYSLIETAKANGHDPYGYLAYIFDTLPRCQTDAERRALLPYCLDLSSYKMDAV
jgi:transposase